MSKLIDLIKSNSGELTYSCEIIPKATDMADIIDLPTTSKFFAVTWHPTKYKSLDLDVPPLRLAKLLRKNNKEVLLHLTCHMLRMEYLKTLLPLLQKENIRNLLVVLGDHYDPSTSDFRHTVQLISTIREFTGEYFCIGTNASHGVDDEALNYLHSKIMSGADFVVTQPIFDVSLFETFLTKYHERNMKVPVLPGVFYMETKENFDKCVIACQLPISLDHIKTDIDAANKFKSVIRELRERKLTTHIHIFTLNKLTPVCNIMEDINRD